MWTFRVVVPSPLLNDDPGFLQAVEDLSVQELVAEPGIEALALPVPPVCWAWPPARKEYPSASSPPLHWFTNFLKRATRSGFCV